MNIASVTVDKNGNPVTKPSSYTKFCMDFTHSTKKGDDRCAESHKKGGEEAAKEIGVDEEECVNSVKKSIYDKGSEVCLKN